MGIPVLVMGESGSGKSTSLRNFKPGTIGVVNVAGKPLPFRDGSKMGMIQTSDYAYIEHVFQTASARAIVIDDSQYLMGFEEMDSDKKGYEKFNSIGLNFVGLVRSVATLAPPDTIVYFLQHVETNEQGILKAKTLGKLIDTHYTLEGLFPIVLLCQTRREGNTLRHLFVTNGDGTNTCKSPMGMFDSLEMDNDLKIVDMTIRDYWGLKPLEVPATTE